MKKFIYPAVIYYDEDMQVYALSIDDLGIIVEGESVEEVHKKAGQFLSAYIECAIKNSYEIPEPTEFDVVSKSNPKEICVLVEANFDDSYKPI